MRCLLICPFFFLLFGEWLLSSEAIGQPYYFKHYQVENGLSNNTIYAILQDRKGFMWFGTKDGLNRFDGVHFKIFRTRAQQHFNADYIRSLSEDGKGFIWIGAAKGLYRFDPWSEAVTVISDSLRDVSFIQEDRMGQLWFLSGFMLCRYDPATDVLEHFTTSISGASFFYLAGDGTKWIATREGLLYSSRDMEHFKRFDLFSHSPSAINKNITKVLAASQGFFFIGTTGHGVKKFDPVSGRYEDILSANEDKTSIYVRDILQRTKNEFWFATESGIFILDISNNHFTNLRKKFLDPYSLNDNAVYTLFRDRESGLWAGTFFGGLNYYTDQYSFIQKYFPDNFRNSIGGNAVREICEDRYRNLWIGTEDGGLSKIDRKSGQIMQFKPTGERSTIAYPNIHGLLPVGNELWIGTFMHGLDIMDISTGKIIRHYDAGTGKNDLKSNFVICLFQNDSGQIFLGTNNGLYRYNRRDDGFELLPGLPPNLFVSALAEGPRNIIWVGTHDRGVYWYDPVSGKLGHPGAGADDNALSSKNVNDIYIDSSNNIWVGTEGAGICRLSPDLKSSNWYTTVNGLPSNFIFKILEDHKRELWITTSAGLVSVDPGFRDLAVYTQSDGLLNNQFNYHSGYKDLDGRLYFGSVKGMISFQPGEFIRSVVIPPVCITGFQVSNEELEKVHAGSKMDRSVVFADRVDLTYRQSSISIDFAALSYISPSTISYEYLLEGLDVKWTKIYSNRRVFFTNLSPGKYTFRLKATLRAGVQSPEKRLIIFINPPVWATTWAYIVYLLVAAFLLYFFVRNYHRKQKTRKEKEIFESKINFFTNVAHEIRTPLTLIKGPVENLLEKQQAIPDVSEDLQCLERNTNRLMDLVSQILDFRQTEIRGFSLDFEKVNVTDLMKEIYLRFQILAKKRNINYELVLPPQELQVMADPEALQKICSNLVNNAVKYSAKLVRITVLPVPKNQENFIIEFENDGNLIPPEFAEKIFEPFYRLKENHHQKGTGIGLTLARSLTELHKGSLYYRVSKKNLNLFVLALPLHPENKAKKN